MGWIPAFCRFEIRFSKPPGICAGRAVAPEDTFHLLPTALE